MRTKKALVWMAFLGLALGVSVRAQDVESDWNDFLHYTMISRFDLAQGFAQRLLESSPDPLEVLELSEANPDGYKILLRMHAESEGLQEVAGKILDLIEEGRYLRRTDPKIIVQEIQRLSTTIRGKIAAQERLKNAGEYAIPYMLSTLADPDRKSEYANIIETLPMIGRPAIRPLTAALQTEQVEVKAEIIKALGKIGYFQSMPYLKYVVENDESSQLVGLAQEALEKIDSVQGQLPAGALFFMLAEKHYDKDASILPAAEFDFSNVWFWDEEKGELAREQVDKIYFNEMMCLQSCEWALKADPSLGKSIGLWLAGFFRAESHGIAMPEYFGEGHADAMTYAVTAGPEYLHQSLERALGDEDDYVSLQVVEAMAVNAGAKSLLYRVGTEQPLAKALQYKDRKVRYSAAIALGLAGPTTEFTGSGFIVTNLAQAVAEEGADDLGAELAQEYSLRAVLALNELAVRNNPIVDLAGALEALVGATQSERPRMQVLAGQVLVSLDSPEAQRAIADQALNEQNSLDVRLAAFRSLSLSAKRNASLLLTGQIDAMYELIQSRETLPDLRSAAAGAFGALNLSSQRVGDLILDQSKS